MPPLPSRARFASMNVDLNGTATRVHRAPLKCSRTVPGKMPMPLLTAKSTQTLAGPSATMCGKVTAAPAGSRKRGKCRSRHLPRVHWAAAKTWWLVLSDATVCPTAQMSLADTALASFGTIGVATARHRVPLKRRTNEETADPNLSPKAHASVGLKTAAALMVEKSGNWCVVQRPPVRLSATALSVELLSSSNAHTVFPAAAITALPTPLVLAGVAIAPQRVPFQCCTSNPPLKDPPASQASLAVTPATLKIVVFIANFFWICQPAVAAAEAVPGAADAATGASAAASPTGVMTAAARSRDQATRTSVPHFCDC